MGYLIDARFFRLGCSVKGSFSWVAEGNKYNVPLNEDFLFYEFLNKDKKVTKVNNTRNYSTGNQIAYKKQVNIDAILEDHLTSSNFLAIINKDFVKVEVSDYTNISELTTLIQSYDTQDFLLYNTLQESALVNFSTLGYNLIGRIFMEPQTIEKGGKIIDGVIGGATALGPIAIGLGVAVGVAVIVGIGILTWRNWPTPPLPPSAPKKPEDKPDNKPEPKLKKVMRVTKELFNPQFSDLHAKIKARVPGFNSLAEEKQNAIFKHLDELLTYMISRKVVDKNPTLNVNDDIALEELINREGFFVLRKLLHNIKTINLLAKIVRQKIETRNIDPAADPYSYTEVFKVAFDKIAENL